MHILNHPGFVRTFHVVKDRAMSIKYDAETKARAVRLVIDHAADYQTEWAAITAISQRLGMTPETLRRWVACLPLSGLRNPAGVERDRHHGQRLQICGTAFSS